MDYLLCSMMLLSLSREGFQSTGMVPALRCELRQDASWWELKLWWKRGFWTTMFWLGKACQNLWGHSSDMAQWYILAAQSGRRVGKLGRIWRDDCGWHVQTWERRTWDPSSHYERCSLWPRLCWTRRPSSRRAEGAVAVPATLSWQE